MRILFMIVILLLFGFAAIADRRADDLRTNLVRMAGGAVIGFAFWYVLAYIAGVFDNYRR